MKYSAGNRLPSHPCPARSDHTGNLPSMPGVYPDYAAFAFRAALAAALTFAVAFGRTRFRDAASPTAVRSVTAWFRACVCADRRTLFCTAALCLTPDGSD